MLGNEAYIANWKRKLDIYETFFPGQMIKTYESGAISVEAKRLIEKLQEKL